MATTLFGPESGATVVGVLVELLVLFSFLSGSNWARTGSLRGQPVDVQRKGGHQEL